MFALCFILALLLPLPQQKPPTPEEWAAMRQRMRQQAVELNELAGNIRSLEDARQLVDAIAKMFADELPPAWATASVRERIARAEYEAVSDPSQLIPEQRLADVWNAYVRTIAAPDETLVTAAEIHNMRDAHYATAQVLWGRGMNQSIWTVPNIYAVGPDGKVANGCRPLEALRVIHDMDMLFDNVRAARERVQKGIVASDQLKTKMGSTPPSGQLDANAGRRTVARLEARTDREPVPPAERRYISEHGFLEFNLLLERLFNELFPE